MATGYDFSRNGDNEDWGFDPAEHPNVPELADWAPYEPWFTEEDLAELNGRPHWELDMGGLTYFMDQAEDGTYTWWCMARGSDVWVDGFATTEEALADLREWHAEGIEWTKRQLVEA